MFDRLRLIFAMGTQGVLGGVEEIGLGFQQWSVAGSQARKEDRVRSVAVGNAWSTGTEWTVVKTSILTTSPSRPPSGAKYWRPRRPIAEPAETQAMPTGTHSRPPSNKQ